MPTCADDVVVDIPMMAGSVTRPTMGCALAVWTHGARAAEEAPEEVRQRQAAKDCSNGVTLQFLQVGFRRCRYDQCRYVKKSHLVSINTAVDDAPT